MPIAVGKMGHVRDQSCIVIDTVASGHPLAAQYRSHSAMHRLITMNAKARIILISIPPFMPTAPFRDQLQTVRAGQGTQVAAASHDTTNCCANGHPIEHIFRSLRPYAGSFPHSVPGYRYPSIAIFDHLLPSDLYQSGFLASALLGHGRGRHGSARSATIGWDQHRPTGCCDRNSATLRPLRGRR